MKPDGSVTRESFTCELLDPVSVSSTSMFEDGQELISNVVHIAANDHHSYTVAAAPTSNSTHFVR